MKEGLIEQSQTKINGHSVELRKFRAPIIFPSGETKPADLTMIFEPSTGLFWWDYYQPSGPDFGSQSITEMLSRAKFYLGKNEIVRFDFSRPDLRIRRCVARYSSIEDGQAHALAEVRSKAGEIEKGRWEWFRAINMATAKAFEPGFMTLAGSASPFPQTKLREVSKRGGRWYLLFDGPNGDSSEVVLNDDYKVVRTKHFPAESTGK
jgi:hypothetical protein